MSKILKCKGFTLVELLIVIAIFGVVIGAVYSLYLTHMRSAYSHDEVVEVQQNLRIAMDTISRDLKVSGFLVPLTTNPFSNCDQTSLQINAASPNGIIARITPGSAADGTYKTTSPSFTVNVEASEAVDAFNVNDKIRLLRTFDNSQPLSTSLSDTKSLVVTAVNRGDLTQTPAVKPTITMEIYNVDTQAATGDFPTGVLIRPGDIIAKAGWTGGSEVIVYRLVPTGGNCPVGSCLARQVYSPPAIPVPSPLPAPLDSEIVASNLSAINFSYLYDDGGEENDPDPNEEKNIRAVRVTITGATTLRTDPNWTPKTRQVTSVIMVRNRRIY